MTQISEEELRDLKELFDVVDLDKGGSISADELAGLMKSLGLKVDEEELAQMMKNADESGEGDIDFDAFVAMMSKRVEMNYTLDEIRSAFQSFENSSSDPGTIRTNALLNAMEKFDLGSEKTMNFVIQQLDPTGSGKIKYNEYLKSLGPL